MSMPPDPRLTDAAEGEEIEIRLDRARIHLFDVDSGEALAHGITEAPQAEAVEGTVSNTEAE